MIGHGEGLVEELPKDRSSFTTWVVLLAGPIIWSLHFVAVYLASEASCTAADTRAPELLPPAALRASVVVATVVAIVAALAAGAWAWRRTDRGDDRHGDISQRDADRAGVAWAGVLLSIGSALAILAVGVPALVLPC